ncbi:potassium-transporting ATPase subunit F [Rugosimonospora africana]|nr:potassium-transporting ATPase subunit F [Rugosimonospora africana]
MSVTDGLLLILSLAVFVYLGVALFKAEKFS